MARSVGQQLRIQDAERDAAAAIAAGRARELKRGLVHVIDNRTSDICLDLAGRKPVVGPDEPFDTLIGPEMNPPFHSYCRTICVVVVPGEVEPHGATERDVDAERRARETDPAPAPNRTERRRAKRERDKRIREDERRRRAARRRARDAGRTGQSGGDRGASTTRPPTTTPTAPSVPPKDRQSGDRIRPPAAPRHRTLREWTGMAAEVNREHDPLSDDDPAMHVILRRQRWTGRPTVLAAGGLLGGLLLYRVLTGEEDDGHPVLLTLGVAGVGIYLATRESDAGQYASPGATVARAQPAPGARIIDRDDLVDERRRQLATLSPGEARSLLVITEDPGRLAAALGYDGVRFPDGTVLLVNPTALVQEEP